jgi:glycosyltransferase involved in cell wall biosynthesis
VRSPLTATAETEQGRERPRLVSVVMPVRNEEEHVGEQLAALAAQTYSGDWELVVVDDKSRDRTRAIVESWADRVPHVRIITPPVCRGQSHARNVGMREARGEFICSCDGNDVAHPEWIERLVSAAVDQDIDLVGGDQELERLNDELARAWTPWKPYRGFLDGYGFLPQLDTANLGVWTAVAREVLFDEDFRFGGVDVAFSWRAQLKGKRVGEAPGAVMYSRVPSSLGHVVRQAYGYGMASPLLYRKFRQIGMPRDLAAARRACWWLALNWSAPFSSSARRGRWLRVAAQRTGRLVGSLRYRAFFP